MDLAKEEKYSDERKYFAILRLAKYKYFLFKSNLRQNLSQNWASISNINPGSVTDAMSVYDKNGVLHIFAWVIFHYFFRFLVIQISICQRFSKFPII